MQAAAAEWLRCSHLLPAVCSLPAAAHHPPLASLAAAYHAIACGADVNHSYSGQAAAQLVWEANLVAGGEAEQPLSPTNLGHTGALHAACRVRRHCLPCCVLAMPAALR